MHCVDCGADLTGMTVGSDGKVECPSCGKTVFFQEDDGTATFHWTPGLLPDSERFEFIERIGEGSFGIVFKAYDKELKRFVAIKSPKHSNAEVKIDLFLREARAASRLRHPNIVTVFDVLESGESVRIVSEFVEGFPLRDWMSQTRPDRDEVCRVCEEICQAIHYAHDQGVVHRDLKPANIVMDEKGAPHILDFGLSYSRNFPMESIGTPGLPIGTPAFMAPEQVRGDSKSIDRWTDVYAIGIILYQCLTNRLPFQGRSSQLFQQILEQPPPKLRSIDPSIPASLEAICLKALAKDPDSRYSTASEMGDDLRRFLSGEIVGAYGKIDARSMKQIGRRHFAKGMAATLGLGFLGSSAYLWRRNAQDNPRTKCVLHFEPSTATVVMSPISIVDGYPDEKLNVILRSGKSQLLSPGYYRLTITQGKDFFSVYRTVPGQESDPLGATSGVPLTHRSWKRTKGIVELPPVRLRPLNEVQANMVFHAGGTMRPVRAMQLLAEKTFDVKPFLIDQDEVSMEAFTKVFPNFVAQDVTGPAVGIAFEHAIAYAEKVGKQVPTIWHWLWATTNGGTTKFPWGDTVVEQPWPDATTEGWIDESRSQPPVKQLYSGAYEWADTPPDLMPLPHAKKAVEGPYQIEPMRNRAIVGGPPITSDKKGILSDRSEPMRFGYYDTTRVFPQVGFRCVRELT